MFELKPLILICLASVLMLNGCSGDNVKTNKPQIIKQENKTTNSINTILYGDMKIGNITIGQPLNQIHAMYGDPDLKTIAHGNGDIQWEYNKRGFIVIGSPIWKIEVFQDFLGDTPRGIHIGSTEKEIKDAYPFAKYVINNTQIFGESVDKNYSIDFILSKGIVSCIILSNESP